MNVLDAIWHLSTLGKEAMPLPQLSCSILPLRSQCGCRLQETHWIIPAHGWLGILIVVFLIPTATLAILTIPGEYCLWKTATTTINLQAVNSPRWIFFSSEIKSETDLFSTSELIPPRENSCWVKDGGEMHGLTNSESYLLRFCTVLYKQVLEAKARQAPRDHSK